jgi:hypothetical protein
MPLLIPNSWDELKEKLAHPLMSEKLEVFKKNVHKDLLTEIPEEKEYVIGEKEHSGPDISILTEAPANAAFLHKATGEPLDLKNCVRLIEGVLGRSTWMHPTHVALYKASDDPRSRYCTADLRTATITAGLALILDWVGDELPDDLVARMKEQLRTRGTDEILDNIERNIYWSDWYISNWCSHIMSGLAVGTAYEEDSDPGADKKLTEAGERTRKFLDVQGDDGGYHEGVAYGGTMMSPIEVSLALEHAGRPTLLNHPYLKKVGDFFLHGICPGFSGIANFSDATYALHSMAYLAFLAKRFERPDWQWVARQLFERSNTARRWDFAWLDPNAPEQKPSLEKRARLFTNTQFAFVRDNWEGDSRYLVVPAGSLSYGHRHADLGSFLLNEFGERQLADSGTHYYYTKKPWHVQTEAHNSLLVNGEGTNWDWGVKLRLERIAPEAYGPHYALITRFEAGDDADVVIEDATKGYPKSCERFVRAFVSLRRGPLLVMDDVKVKPEKAGAELELRFIATGKVETRDNGFTISHPRSECRGEVLLPAGVSLSLAEEQQEAHGGVRLFPVRVVHTLDKEETEARLVTLILPYLKGERPPCSATARADENTIDCRVSMNGLQWHAVWDLDKNAVEVRKER